MNIKDLIVKIRSTINETSFRDYNSSGIEYDNTPRGKMIERIVEGIMKDEVGNLEWVVAHWVWDMDESDLKEYARLLKIKYYKEDPV